MPMVVIVLRPYGIAVRRTAGKVEMGDVRATEHLRCSDPLVPLTRLPKQGSLCHSSGWAICVGSSGRFGRPAPSFHAHAVERGFLLSFGAGADDHGISTGAPRHLRLLHTGGAVPPEVSHVRGSLAVAVSGTGSWLRNRRPDYESLASARPAWASSRATGESPGGNSLRPPARRHESARFRRRPACSGRASHGASGFPAS